MISSELISELKQIFIDDFGLSITTEEITKIAHSLISYFEILTIIQNNPNGERDIYES